MATLEDLTLRQNRATTPYDPNNVTTRVGKITDAAKDMFVWELRDYFSRKGQDRIALVPTIEKFAADNPGPAGDYDPLETVVRMMRQYPDLTEKLPYIGVTITNHKNVKLGFSTKFVDTVMPRPRLVAGLGAFGPVPAPVTVPPAAPTTTWDDNQQPGVPVNVPPTGDPTYSLTNGDWVEITTTFDGVEHVSRFIFDLNLLGGSPQTPRAVADVINLQALYCHADVISYNGVQTLILEPGGPLGKGKRMSIQRTNATVNFDNNINFVTTQLKAPSNQFPAANRYMSSHDMTVTLVIGSEGENIRSELSDVLTQFFTLVLDDRQFTLWGRSFFSNVPDETYQLIIKDESVGLTGEQEVPRPDDPARKIYLNRLNVPITLIQYIDRTVQMGVVAQQSDTLPGMN
jgi:hypothetical protein